MATPALPDLPAAPAGRTGWPWTLASSTLPGERAWPRLTIITPSYNQARFLEETLRSVLLQGYPNLEYFVIDGGSSDGSLDLLRKYAPWLTGWVSEPDRGQADAVNKGFARATGDVLGWLNSDDIYLPGALRVVAEYLNGHPEVDVVYGDCDYVDEAGRFVRHYVVEDFNLERLVHIHDYIPQPATFFRRRAWQAAGPLNLELRYTLDYELWLRMARSSTFARLPQILATYRLAEGTKTVSSSRFRVRSEELRMTRRYGRSLWRWLQYWLPAVVKYRSALAWRHLKRLASLRQG